MDAAAARDIVRRKGWLALQTAAFQNRLLGAARLTSYPAGTFTFHIGDDPGGLYGVVSGGFGIHIESQGEGSVLAHIARAGIWFGHGPVLTRRPRSMAFRAMADSLAFHVSLPSLDALTRNDPEVLRILGTMSEHNMGVATWALSDLLIPAADRRIAATLLRVTGVLEGNPPDDDAGYRLTQSELGAMANASRDLVNRTLAVFQKQSLIRVSYGHISVLEPERLARLAYPQ